MRLLLDKGDYVPDGRGGFTAAEGTSALMNEALFRLSCRRGSFPFLPELGSRLHTLCREKPASRNMTARQYAVEALEGLDVTVTDAEVTENADGTAQVTVYLTVADAAEIVEVNL